MKNYLRFFYVTTIQIRVLIRFSKYISDKTILGKVISILIDNLMLLLYGLEVSSRTLNVKNLIVGHSTGVVLGGNGISCSSNLQVSSGVVFGRRYNQNDKENYDKDNPMFVIEESLQVGANTVLLGPLKIKGPSIIGAMSLVTRDITEPGIYVGIPAVRIGDIE